MLLVPALQLGGQQRTERPDHRERVERDDVHLAAEGARRRRDLAADEPGTDDDDPR